MKKIIFLILFTSYWSTLTAQLHENLVSYSIAGTPVNGVKIKTNIPFVSGADMPTIFIKGFSYGGANTINLQLVFYIYKNSAGNTYFYTPTISSSGSYTPIVQLANENGKVVVFINDKVYYQRFWVDAFSKHSSTYYQNWTVVDEPLSGTAVVEVPYKNSFKGQVQVNGMIRAKEIKVEATNWPDYVFQEDYELLSLQQTEEYIKLNGHLPDVPKADKIESEGISLGEMNKLLLKKIEEITLHLIQKEKDIEELKRIMSELR